MNPSQVTPETLQSLPEAIWLPSGTDSVVIYRGTPLEIVRTMAMEMGADVTIRRAMAHIVDALIRRGIRISLPHEFSEDKLSRYFVYALLATGVGKPMAKA